MQFVWEMFRESGLLQNFNVMHHFRKKKLGVEGFFLVTLFEANQISQGRFRFQVFPSTFVFFEGFPSLSQNVESLG